MWFCHSTQSVTVSARATDLDPSVLRRRQFSNTQAQSVSMRRKRSDSVWCVRARALALQMSPHLHTQHQRKTMATVRRLGPGAEVSPAFPSGPTMPRFAQYEIALDHTNTRHARHARPRCCCLVLGDFGRCKRRNFTTTTTPSGGVWNTSASTEDKENGPRLAQNSAQCAPLACGPTRMYCS